jgi:hypothetical protein
VKLRGLGQEERDQVVMYSISPGAGAQPAALRDEKTAVKNP